MTDTDRPGGPRDRETVHREHASPEDEQILEGIIETLRDTLSAEELARLDLQAIGPTTPFLSLPLDSLALMALMAGLEDRFRVFIPDDRAYSFERVGDLVDFIGRRLAAKAQRR